MKPAKPFQMPLVGQRPDGLYRVGDSAWMFIADGVLFLPVEVLHPVVLLTCGRPIRVVGDMQGNLRHFIRAQHVMEDQPDIAAEVAAIAAQYGCQV